MKEYISVNRAIKRGHLVINAPVILIMFGFPAAAMYLFSEKLIPNWSVAISFFLGFGIAWIYWSYSVTKWRLWAFENVRNVHELKKRAVQSGLIWSDTKWFNKTEFRTKKDKLKWEKLQKKFEKEDVFFEDRSVPRRTVIYYSKTKNTFEFIIMLIGLIVGINLLINTDQYILGTIFTIAGGYFGFKELRQVFDTRPQIIIDDKGIKTTRTEFKNWSEIKNEEIVTEHSSKRANSYLFYEYKDGYEKLKIDDYNTTPKELENFLRTYRIRNTKSSR